MKNSRNRRYTPKPHRTFLNSPFMEILAKFVLALLALLILFLWKIIGDFFKP